MRRTLATLRRAEFGFFGVVVLKLTNKLPKLSLYKTVHETFTSYGSSWFENTTYKRIRLIDYYSCSTEFLLNNQLLDSIYKNVKVYFQVHGLMSANPYDYVIK